MYFQKVLQKTPQPKGSDFLDERLELPHSFFVSLSNYLKKNRDIIITTKSKTKLQQ
jgi:hypothetical protein